MHRMFSICVVVCRWRVPIITEHERRVRMSAVRASISCDTTSLCASRSIGHTLLLPTLGLLLLGGERNNSDIISLNIDDPLLLIMSCTLLRSFSKSVLLRENNPDSLRM